MQFLPKSKSIIIAISFFSLTACERNSAELPVVQNNSFLAEEASAEPYQIDTNQWLDQWRISANECYSQARLSILELEAQTELFLDAPTQLELNQLQLNWDSAHSFFITCTTYHQPISFTFEPDLLRKIELIDAWPIQGGYIDYLPGYPHTGIINDAAGPISTGALISQHQLTDSFDASVGFHAFEFLIWGEDRNRSSDDFIAQSTEINEDGFDINPNNRRRSYLAGLMELIKGQTDFIADRWSSEGNSFVNSMQQLNDLQKNAYFLSSIASYLNQINYRYFNPEYENDLFMVDESPFAQTTREGLLSSYEEFESLTSQLIHIELMQNSGSGNTKIEQLNLISGLLKSLSHKIDLLPPLSEKSLSEWSNASSQASLITYQLLDHIHSMSKNLKLKLTYKNN